MYRLDLPREDMDVVLVNGVDSVSAVTLHTFGHVRNSTDDDWIDVASWHVRSPKCLKVSEGI